MSQRRLLNIAGILILMGITSAVSIFAYTWIVGGSGEASQPISAPTLSAEDIASPVPDAQFGALQTQVAVLQAENAALLAGAGAAATVVPAVPTVEPTAVAASVTARYSIVAEESQVRFNIFEELQGQPKTVVGITDQVAGEIFVDFGTPANTRVGVIRINARTLTTDNENRNRAIRSEILESRLDEYEFAEFTPTSVSGLPAQLAVGQAITFQIIGDLKIRNIVQSVTFDVTATAVSEDRLEGSARTVVTRTQYNLIIPNAPGVANVGEEVTLEIDFVAARVQE